MTTPTNFSRVLDFNMGTKKSQLVQAEYATNCVKGQGADTLLCEKVQMTMRDGFQVPVVLIYDKRFYTDESPWIIFTKGAASMKEDLAMTA